MALSRSASARWIAPHLARPPIPLEDRNRQSLPPRPLDATQTRASRRMSRADNRDLADRHAKRLALISASLFTNGDSFASYNRTRLSSPDYLPKRVASLSQAPHSNPTRPRPSRPAGCLHKVLRRGLPRAFNTRPALSPIPGQPKKNSFLLPILISCWPRCGIQFEAVGEILKSGVRFLKGFAPRTLADIYTDIATIAGIMGVPDKGATVIAAMQTGC